MSVLIKGMDMPKDCNECPLTYLSGGLRICQFACLKNDGCPLVEVKTPHGRLIDADEFCEDNNEALDNAVEKARKKHGFITNARTVSVGSGKENR